MSTIIWDGECMIADSLERTHLPYNIVLYSHNAVKIVVPKGVTYKGEEVQVVGGSGLSYVVHPFQDNEAFKEISEVTHNDFFSWTLNESEISSVIMVLPSKVVVAEVGANRVSFTEIKRDDYIAIGSGSKLANIVGKKTPASNMMACMMELDKNTGGTMTVWKDGVITTRVPVPKKFLSWSIYVGMLKCSFSKKK